MYKERLLFLEKKVVLATRNWRTNSNYIKLWTCVRVIKTKNYINL